MNENDASSLGAIICGVGGGDPSRISVAGTVVLDGKPLKTGTIVFSSSPVSVSFRVAAGSVQNGEYAISSSDSLVPGTYLVQIRSSAHEEIPASTKRNAYEIPPDQSIRVPSRYNDESVLLLDFDRGDGINRCYWEGDRFNADCSGASPPTASA